MIGYEFELSDTDPNSFLFKTQLGLFYEIRFVHTPYLFDNAPNCSDDVYELSVILAGSGPGKTAPDPAISQTVFAICQAFIARLGHPIFLFICDSRDGRQAIRARTFSRWFDEIANSYLVKIDGRFPDERAVVNYVSLIIQLEHPHYKEAVTAFTDLIVSYNRPK